MYSEELIKRRTEEIVNELKREDVCGTDKFVRKLDRTVNTQDYLDILVEGRFAAVLARNGFLQIQMEPFNKGPDIKASYNGYTIYFEVTRRRPMAADRELGKTKGSWVVSPDRTDNVIGKITEKLGQLQRGELNIIVIWSNTVRLGVPEVQEAFKYIQGEINQNTEKYEELSSVLLIQDEKVDLTMPKESYLFPNDRALNQLPICLAKKLKSL